MFIGYICLFMLVSRSNNRNTTHIHIMIELSLSRIDMERSKTALGCWITGVHTWYVECDRFYNKFIVRCYRRTSCCFLFSSESLTFERQQCISFHLLLISPPNLGAKRDGNQSICEHIAAWKVGHMGSHVDFRGFIQRGKHFQFLKARLHLLCESPFGATSSLVITDGDWHHEVLLFIRSRFVCLQ